MIFGLDVARMKSLAVLDLVQNCMSLCDNNDPRAQRALSAARDYAKGKKSRDKCVYHIKRAYAAYAQQSDPRLAFSSLAAYEAAQAAQAIVDGNARLSEILINCTSEYINRALTVRL